MLARACAVAVALAVFAAQAASANTILHVDGATGTDGGGNTCQSTPCKTIQNAITQSESFNDLVTIAVSAGTYTEDLSLGALDSGLTITGAGSGANATGNTVITGITGNPTINSTTASSLALSHLRIVNPLGDPQPIINSTSTELGLTDVALDGQGTGVGIDAGADMSMTGGSITLENAGAGAAFVTSGELTVSGTPISTNSGTIPAIVGAGPISVTNSPITMSNPGGSATAVLGGPAPITIGGSPIDVKGTGGAISAPFTLTMTGSAITLEGSAGTTPAIAGGGPGSSVSFSGAPIDLQGKAPALTTTGAPVTISAAKITLDNGANAAPALTFSGRDSSLTNVTISGAWTGPGVLDTGSIRIVDSSITSGPSTTAPMLDVSDGSASGIGSDLSIIRSTLEEQSTTTPGVIANNMNVAVVSSALLGGLFAFDFEVLNGKTRSATLASSTVDAGMLGSRDGGPIQSVLAHADNTAGSVATVTAEGSILVEAPASRRVGTNGTATVNCSGTEVPGTTQAAAGTDGAINCATGASGNTSTSLLSSIFANPATGYALNPSWSGVDSVPEAAISLPAPFSDSSTDLLGNPRVVNGIATCQPGVRDKGAIELTGHQGVVPAPAIASPASVLPGVAGTFTGSAANVPSNVPLTFSWHSSDGGSGSVARLTHTFVRPGSYTLSLTVTGAAGCTATKSVSVPVHGLDVITVLKISPTVFVAAGSGPSVTTTGRPRSGTTISYRGTEAATTTFTVQLGKLGRIRGGTCRVLTGKHLTGKRCRVFLSVGAFSHTDTPGSVSFHFTGRLLGRKLPPGVYRLRAIPSDPVGKGTAVFAGFTLKP
ncbi:MAG TPA: PKD domain-containing protein [Solirubrobacteraceae bacterium]|nr:PKD domain-containing protein [Solirubrobacteraceae bacterium]